MSKKKKHSNRSDELKVEKVVIDKHSDEDKKSEYVKFDNKELNNNSYYKRKSHVVVNLFLILLLISSLCYFAVCLFVENNTNSLQMLSESLLLVLFSLLFVIVSITSNRKKKGTVLLSSLLLLAYFGLRIATIVGFVSFPNVGQVPDFVGKSLTEVVKWAEANQVSLEQDYEYSDMIPEYSIISQDIKVGSKLKDTKSITVAVSEGASPYKEVIIPNMISWDSERVLNFIKENYLSNVEVEFVESDKAKDTVIEQSKSGNLARNEEIKLTFSAGEEFEDGEVKLIDFTEKSKFEVMFYLKQHRIRYEFKDKFSSKIKRGYTVSQSIKAGTMIKADDEKMTVYISKGPKIEVLDLKKMTMSQITNWVIKNKLKLEFSDRYDDSTEINEVLEVNYKKGDIIEQNTVIKIVISKGKLKMPKFKSLSEFREWADKYAIKYEEQREFSDSVETGEVISYSYKTGDVIKNDDTVIVRISDGKKCEVPNLKGLTKTEAISKLEKADLKYNFVYKASSSVSKDKVISQSISSGSEVSKGTTITVTLSNGNKEIISNNSSTSSTNSNNNNGSSNSNSSSNDDSSNAVTTPPKTCNSCTILKSQISAATSGYDGNCSGAAANIKRKLEASCPGLTVNVSCRAVDGYITNDFVEGFRGGSTDSCSTISIVLAK